MNVSSKHITLTSLDELIEFIDTLHMNGEVKLVEPVVDLTEKILIQENVPIKQPTLDKLHEIEGQYNPEFKVKIDPDLLKAIRAHITAEILAPNSTEAGEFANHLINEASRKAQSYIYHAFQSSRLVLVSYKLLCERPAFFAHLANMAKLSLGMTLRMRLRLRMIHRFTFLAGFCADLALADGDEWERSPENDAERLKRVEMCATFLDRMNVLSGLSTVVRQHYFSREMPRAPQTENFLADFLDEEEDESEEAANPPTVEQSTEAVVDEQRSSADDSPDTEEEKGEEEPFDEIDDDSVQFVAEVLKISRFTAETIEILKGRPDRERELVSRIAYNAARGFLSQTVVMPVVQAFTRHAELAEYMMNIADIEAKCPLQNSAWAYPKPRATQVLCAGNHIACPYIISGHDIHVLNSRESYGWLGKILEEKIYKKCKLENELPAAPVFAKLDAPAGRKAAG